MWLLQKVAEMVRNLVLIMSWPTLRRSWLRIFRTVSVVSFKIFELFFCKNIPLSRCVEFVMGLWMSQSVSQSVRDVCISHQSDWIYYKKPIEFLFVKVNGL